MQNLTEINSELELLFHFPTVLREFSLKGLVVVNENGNFLTNEANP